MRHILAALTVILVPSFAVAEILPPGCYVADFYRTDLCWYTENEIYDWGDSGTGLTQGQMLSYYGGPVTAIINQNAENRNNWASCLNDLGTAIGAANSLETRLANCNAGYNELYGQATTLAAGVIKQKALIKKLRKKCGPACKKIK